MAANPVIAVTLAVAGLITVLVLLIRNFDDVKAKAAQFWQGMVMLFNQGRELSGLAVQILIKQMKLWFFSFWEWFATRFPGLAAAVEVTFGRITEIMGSGIDFWKNLFQGMFALFTGDIDGFKEHFAAAFGFLGEYFAGIIDSMGGYIDLLWGWLEPVYNFLTGIFAGAVDKVKGGIAKVGEFFGFDGPEGPQPGGPYPGIIRPEATNNNSRQINVRSSISLAVPEGTPQHQRQSLQDSAERAVQAAFDRELRSLMANAAGGEVR